MDGLWIWQYKKSFKLVPPLTAEKSTLINYDLVVEYILFQKCPLCIMRILSVVLDVLLMVIIV